MPIVWRYFIYGYLRIFSLSICTFIAVLLVSRFKDIARFAALSGQLAKTGLFVLQQIPLILPVAMPISALIAALLLSQRLSRTSEWTALRASGLSLSLLFTPLLSTALLLSILHFAFCAEISPYCRRESKALFYRKTSSNPLFLMQRQNLVKIKHAYLNMNIQEEGKVAKDFLLVVQNDNHQRLTLISASQLQICGIQLLGQELTIISHLPSDLAADYDSLIIENQASMSTAAPLLSAALKKNRPHLEVNALGLRMLRMRMAEEGTKLARAARVEILRRISLSLTVFSCTLLGSACGIEIRRLPSKKPLMIALGFTLLLFLSYFLGKGLKTYPIASTYALLLPHPLIWAFCILRLRHIAMGRA